MSNINDFHNQWQKDFNLAQSNINEMLTDFHKHSNDFLLLTNYIINNNHMQYDTFNEWYDFTKSIFDLESYFKKISHSFFDDGVVNFLSPIIIENDDPRRGIRKPIMAFCETEDIQKSLSKCLTDERVHRDNWFNRVSRMNEDKLKIKPLPLPLPFIDDQLDTYEIHRDVHRFIKESTIHNEFLQDRIKNLENKHQKINNDRKKGES